MAYPNWHYLDIETSGLHPSSAVITQVQIAKRWGSKNWGKLEIIPCYQDPGDLDVELEAAAIRKLMELGYFNKENAFAFCSIGWNLPFERLFLKGRAIALGILPEEHFDDDYWCKNIEIDGIHIARLANRLRVFGTSMDKWTGKQGTGKEAIAATVAKDWPRLRRYAEQETHGFFKWFDDMLTVFPTFMEDVTARMVA